MLEFEILGPLVVRTDGGEVAISGARRRALLIRLLTSANQSVPSEVLIDDIWDQDPPSGASQTLQSHLSFLRKILVEDRIRRSAGGYALICEDAELDGRQFEIEHDLGSQAHDAGDHETSVRLLGTALARWHGDALADVNTAAWTLPHIARFDRLRESTFELRIDSLLALGHHLEAVSQAESAVTSYSFNERLWAQLMLALYRSGRQADALRSYQRLRSRLGDELGIEPSGELVALDEAILLQKPELNWTPPPQRQRTGLHGAPRDGDTDRHERLPLPPRLVVASATNVVGRQAEQQRLRALWKQAEEGSLRVGMLGGEPGIGKTSLAATLATEAWESGGIVLYGRCDDGLGLPYQPWVEAFSHLIRHGPDALLEGHLTTRFAELARLLPELSERTGVEASTVLPDESERYLLFGAVVDLVNNCSTIAPTLLVLDDLHWADRPTVQLLRHVVTSDSQWRVMIVGTFRDSELGGDHPLAEALATFHREQGVDRFSLRGLGDLDLMEMLESHLREDLPDDAIPLRNALLEETGGNPFFVSEMLRHLRETGAVTQAGDERSMDRQHLDLTGLPVSLREVIGHRVGRLGRSAVQWLTMAAVIGRDFDIELLASVVNIDQADLVTPLESAVEAGILVEGPVAGQFSFAHALTGRALYQDLSVLRRARAHRSVAEAIEDQCGGDVAHRVGELAFHWANATQPQELGKAIDYAQRAGDRALLQLAPDEAARWYGEALQLLDHEDPDNTARRASLLVQLGEAQRQTGSPEHRATLLEAARLASDADDTETLVRAALANNRGFHSSTSSGDEERVAVLRLALERLGDIDTPERARLLAVLSAETLHFLLFDERFALAVAAVECARRAGDPITLADVLVRSHESISMPGTLDLRVAWAQEACDIAPEDNHFLRWLVHGVRSIVAHESADLTAMRQSLEIFKTEAERIGQPLCLWVNQIYQSWNQILVGDLAEAERLSEEALHAGLASGEPDALFLYGTQIIDIRFCQGRMGELLPLMEQMTIDYPGPTAFRALHCLSAAEAGDLELARDLVDRDLTSGLEVYEGATWLTAQVAWAIAAVRCNHGEAAQFIYDRLVPWHGKIATIAITAGMGCVDRALGILATHLGDFGLADRWFGEALAIDYAMESPMHIAWTQTSWGDMLVRRGGTPDRTKAAELIGLALAAAQNFDFPRVAIEAAAVQLRMG